jgi:hypothetical protein
MKKIRVVSYQQIYAIDISTDEEFSLCSASHVNNFTIRICGISSCKFVENVSVANDFLNFVCADRIFISVLVWTRSFRWVRDIVIFWRVPSSRGFLIDSRNSHRATIPLENRSPIRHCHLRIRTWCTKMPEFYMWPQDYTTLSEICRSRNFPNIYATWEISPSVTERIPLGISLLVRKYHNVFPSIFPYLL